MDIKEYVTNSMQLTRQGTLNAIQGITQSQLAWRAAPNTNSIGFLLWHTVRTEDGFFHRYIQPNPTPELWERDGWKERLNVGPLPTTYEWSEEQLASFQIPPLQELLAYAEAVRQDSLRIIKEIDTARLDAVVTGSRMNWPVSRYLHQASHHEAHHQGAISYLVGLMRSHGIS